MNSTSPALPEEATMNSTASSAKTRFRVEGMDCASCATKIENALQRMPGVRRRWYGDGESRRRPRGR
jgi:hypothetical protein